MLVRNIEDIYFSQLALVTYQSCQLKFRRRYLEGLFWPGNWALDPEQRELVDRGRLFHLLAQRYYSGLEAVGGAGQVPRTVLSWFEKLRSMRPFVPEEGVFLPEYELRLCTERMKLLAKYDLVYITPDGRAVIYDWKTGPSKPKASYWKRHLQTTVYRYLLCAAGSAYSPRGEFRPEDISIIYWNPQHPGVIEPVGYSEKEFKRDGRRLKELIEEIVNKSFEEFLPTGDQKRCGFCEYMPICHGQRAGQVELEEEDLDIDIDWEDIDEIRF